MISLTIIITVKNAVVVAAVPAVDPDLAINIPPLLVTKTRITTVIVSVEKTNAKKNVGVS